MATKIYLPSSGSAAIIPSTWNFPYQVASPLTYKGVLSPSSTALTTKLDATGTTSGYRWAMLRWVLGPLAGQSISGTVRGILSCMESNAGANANLAIAVKIIQPSGADRSVLLAATSSDAASAPYELTVSPMATKIFYTSAEVEPLTLTTQTATAGDYLVIEIGFYEATTVSRNISLRYGDAGGSDFAYTVGLTTDLNPWVEFSANLTWLTNYTLWVGTGAFSETGNDAKLLASRKVLSATGSYTETGNNARLSKGYAVLEGAGAFSLTGNNAVLTYTPVSGDKYLFADTGSFVLTGSDARLLASRKVYSSTGVFFETGSNVILLIGHKIYATAGSFSLTGNSARVLISHKIYSSAGAFTLTGNNALLQYRHVIRSSAGSFILTGNNAILTYTGGGYSLWCSTGTFSETGNNAILAYRQIAKSGTGAFSLTGNNALLQYRHAILSSTGAFILAGQGAILVYIPSIILGAGERFQVAVRKKFDILDSSVLNFHDKHVAIKFPKQ